MKRIFIILMMVASPAWGQSYEYMQQLQQTDNAADMESMQFQMRMQQEQMRQEMQDIRSQMAAQRLQQTIDAANARDEANYSQ